MPATIVGRTTKPDANKPLKAVFYGPPGSGKTQLLSTAPKPLLVDFDRGSRTLVGSDIDIFAPESWDDVNDVYYTFASGKHPYESILLDTVSMMQQLAEIKTDLMSAFVNGRDPRHTYGQIAAYMRDAVWKIAQLPVNVIMSAHIRIKNDEENTNPEEGTFDLVPDVTPSILKTLSAFPDVIGRTYVRRTPKGPIYAVNFGPDPRGVAKERNLGLPNDVANLTIPKLIELSKQKETNNE